MRNTLIGCGLGIAIAMLLAGAPAEANAHERPGAHAAHQRHGGAAHGWRHARAHDRAHDHARHHRVSKRLRRIHELEYRHDRLLRKANRSLHRGNPFRAYRLFRKAARVDFKLAKLGYGQRAACGHAHERHEARHGERDRHRRGRHHARR